MSTFSRVACYATLTTCSQKDVISAYARMVAYIATQKKYRKCTAEQLVKDFEDFYKFRVPYHPMCTIMNQCVKLDLFTYNSLSHSYSPNYNCSDNDDFFTIIQGKEAEYKKLLERFSDFLIKKYNKFYSPEALDEEIRAFIEGSGIKTRSDHKSLLKAKEQYFFAEFLILSEEQGHTEILDYLDSYLIGMSLSEVFIYNENPDNFTSNNICVYFDTGLLFKLFGIDSSNHTDSYIQYLRNMQRMGIRIKVFEHTVNEMIGIIEGSKHWIGNPDFDATLSSECTYFFVNNEWTVEEVNNLSIGIRSRLKDDFNISIDRNPYLKYEDIHTPYETDIRDMIVSLYKENDPALDVDEKQYTIDQDAHSIFLIHHYNGNRVAYHINDVENIFVTTNRSLARVGYNLSYRLAQSKDYFIPSVINDIKWGTLIWFNSPATISSISRPRLVSAAYAAFRPTPDLTKKLYARLADLESEGKITPEQCYLLKVNPIAQQLLASKTMNDPDKFIDATPLEILKELGRESFEQGSASRQAEVDSLTEEREKYRITLAKERHLRNIENLEHELQVIRAKIIPIKDEIIRIKKELDELNRVKFFIDQSVERSLLHLKITSIIVCIIVLAAWLYIGIKHSFAQSLIASVFPVGGWLIALLFGKKITYSLIKKYVEEHVRSRQNSNRRYSDDTVSILTKKQGELIATQKELDNAEGETLTKIKAETEKMDRFSIDTTLLEEAVI